jgi:hypothetical protein
MHDYNIHTAMLIFTGNKNTLSFDSICVWVEGGETTFFDHKCINHQKGKHTELHKHPFGELIGR